MRSLHEFANFLFRGTAHERSAGEVDEEGPASALHHAIGCDRRIDPSGDQAGDFPADAHRHSARPLNLFDRVVDLFGEQFEIDCEVGIFQADFLACSFTDGGADVPRDLHGGQSQPFVGSFRRYAKGGKRFRSKRVDDRLAERSQVWMGQIEGQPMGERKVGDPEDSCEPFFDGLVRNRVRQDHANPAAKILDASDAEVLQGPLDIAYEPLLEIFPVAAFEGEFVVVDDRASHGLVRMLKMAANVVLGSTKSSTYP